jgi:phosphatidylglycerophosphate synthase
MAKDYFRDISVKLLFPIFIRSGLSANQITVLNFLTLGLLSLALFLSGCALIGLLTAGLMAMVDYVDGTIARAKGGNTAFGAYLDTSLDWLYLMLLIGVLGFHYNCILYSYIALMMITFGNWVEYNGKVKFHLPFIFGIKFLLVIGIIFNIIPVSLLAIAVTQGIRTGIMYERSIK